MMKREVIIMGVVQATQKDIELLARLMRAEAESDGNMGMLLVGNVCVNRVLANCHDFKNINTKEACKTCKYKNFKSNSDVNLGDFWGVETLYRAPEIPLEIL